MTDYERTDKMDWFIRKMSSGWFSRKEILALAATEFPSTSGAKMEGTIGQYWSDCVNSKWPTHKTTRGKGLRVITDTVGRRRITKDDDVLSLPSESIDVSSPKKSSECPVTLPGMKGESTKMDPRFSDLLKQIYTAVAGMEEMFPGRHFTPDGRMVGSIGEAIAAVHYGVQLYPPGHREFDGQKGEKEIQIKATQRNSVDLKPCGGTLLVLKLEQDGAFEEIYNGDAERVWNSLSHRKATKAGEKSISLRQLRIQQVDVREEERIARELDAGSK